MTIFNIQGAFSDPADQRRQTLVIYALTGAAVNELTDLENGMLRKSSGDGLHIRKITMQDLQNDRALAGEIYDLALTGCLGFAQEGGPVRFRQDIAEKLGTTRTFKVISHEKPDNVEEVEVDIQGIDIDAYAALVASASDKDKDQKLKEEHQDTPSASISKAGLTGRKNALSTHQNSLAVQNLFAAMNSQLKTNEENRRKHAEQKKEFQDEIDRTKLKDRIIKDEIKQKEINDGEKIKSALRMNRNFDKPTHNK